MKDGLPPTEEDLEWHSHPTFTDFVAAKRLVSEMIAVSMDEFRQLRLVGILSGTAEKASVNAASHINGHLKKKSQGYYYVKDVQALITFFNEREYAIWIDRFNLNIEPSNIEKHL